MQPVLGQLIAMHNYRRPLGSATERVFINRYISPLPGAEIDQWGNWHVKIGTSRTLFSCHTDTVAHEDGYQTTHYDPSTGVLALSRKARNGRSNCLGADDTVGVFLMLQLIARQIPGHYVFHYGEERGCIGSSALNLQVNPTWFAQFDRAIAFDRHGKRDVITHQSTGRCCSDTFALALATLLNSADGSVLNYAPSNRGIYTDTAEYVDNVAECTNLAVGYEDEHSWRESVDTRHVLHLLDVLSSVDLESLPTARDPKAVDVDDRYQWFADRWTYLSGGKSRRYVDCDLPDYDRPLWQVDQPIDDSTDDSTDTRNLSALDRMVLSWDDLEDDELTALDDRELATYLDPDHARVQASLRRAQLEMIRRCAACGHFKHVESHGCCRTCLLQLEDR